MGHTQLKIGMQGGHVEHRGEIEVKVVQKEKKIRPLDPSRKSTVQPNQEDSESRPLNHMYLRKGSIWTQEVNLCNI